MQCKKNHKDSKDRQVKLKKLAIPEISERSSNIYQN